MPGADRTHTPFYCPRFFAVLTRPLLRPFELSTFRPFDPPIDPSTTPPSALAPAHQSGGASAVIPFLEYRRTSEILGKNRSEDAQPASTVAPRRARLFEGSRPFELFFVFFALRFSFRPCPCALFDFRRKPFRRPFFLARECGASLGAPQRAGKAVGDEDCAGPAPLPRPAARDPPGGVVKANRQQKAASSDAPGGRPVFQGSGAGEPHEGFARRRRAEARRAAGRR